LGTMTFGQQNTESEGHEQLEYATNNGINFIDTAEMYSVPGRPETQGATERIIGTWLQKSGKREEIVLATKATGPSPAFKHISENLGFSKSRLIEALEGSLIRLKTDYIDVYQLHWPERKTNFFGQLGYVQHDSQWQDNFDETLETLQAMVTTGKIRHWGLSNETAWGVMRTCGLADLNGLNRPLTIQNPYNLLNRSFEVGLAEIAIRENIGLLAYSPLGFGLLSGKFHKHIDTPNDRINQFKNLARYNGAKSHEATAKYIQIAEEAGISPAQMALAFVNNRPFVNSTIIGATNMSQLKENISSAAIVLSPDILSAIDKVHMEISNPAP
jgi:aryl-alcohol dehydrogenase-like predicted oxidoreductase